MRTTAASGTSGLLATVLALAALSASPVAGQSYNFTHLAGAGSAGAEDGVGRQARFNHPQGIAVDGQGTVYLADTWNSTIRRITPEGVVTTLAGLAGNSGSIDGTGSEARFYYPRSIALDPAGNIFVADSDNHTIRKVTAAGVVTTLAGLAGNPGSADGTGSDARFYYPRGVSLDAAGNLYVADSGNVTIRKMTPSGVVTTLAGQPGSKGSRDGTGSAAQFLGPWSVAVSPIGNVYVLDLEGSLVGLTIRKISSGAAVATLVRHSLALIADPGPGYTWEFDTAGLAVDGLGNILVASGGNHTIVNSTPGGVVTKLAGMSGEWGDADGSETLARFRRPGGIAVDRSGNLYVADTDNNAIRKGTLLTSLPPVADFSVTPSSPTIGQPAQFTDASGGDPVSWSWSFGDGGISTDRNPTHVFATAGLFPVSLTVWNAAGFASVATRQDVTVQSRRIETGAFNGDGKANLAVYRPSSGTWYAQSASGISTATTWGEPGDIPVPADYDGDGVTNVAVYRPGTGTWWVRRADGSSTATVWGVPGDLPVPGDFDGDRKADFVMFRPAAGISYVLKSTGGWVSTSWGAVGDTPVSGDFDGDGKADFAVVRKSGGKLVWWILKSSTGYANFDAVEWGVAGDVPVPADYEGYGRTNVAVYSLYDGLGNWKIRPNFGTEFSLRGWWWGRSGDIPQPADFDGDGKAEVAVYRPGTGEWWLWSNHDWGVKWGIPGDVPVTAPRY